MFSPTLVCNVAAAASRTPAPEHTLTAAAASSAAMQRMVDGGQK
eukprot:CAMPEP_0197613048 /NCGR_PEP_ID=MMETSP1326-20131121/58452_1 /TAXON_ID=1155430 /ORGANISM="Genus nov. species nov., Strain RCC2288" /LENGTH=43 /DNA_ID= /DNA_START= /DNA_END= /DNA_ORIENTATION=